MRVNWRFHIRTPRQNQNSFNKQKNQHRKQEHPPDFPLQNLSATLTVFPKLKRHTAKKISRFVHFQNFRLIFRCRTIHGHKLLAAAINSSLKPDVFRSGGINTRPLFRSINGTQPAAACH